MWFRKRLASDQQVVDLLRTMHVEQGRLAGEVEKLKAGHNSLRGFVYSKLRKVVQEEEDDGGESAAPAAHTNGSALPPNLSRAELRRKLTETGRFIPGRPPRHE